MRSGVQHAWTALAHRAERAVGGRARGKVIVLLAAVIALDGADKATVSVNAGSVERVFDVGHTGIGLLISLTSLSGAVFTLPAGVLTDRVDRTRLLAGSVILWSVATVLAGSAGSYTWLLMSRVALGAVTATAGPAVASLMGDYFPAAERARVYGVVLAGEMFGTGIGYVLSNTITALLTWRYSFAWLALPGVVLAWTLWRVPEPPRGGAGWLRPGQREIPAIASASERQEARETDDGPEPPASAPQVVRMSKSRSYPDRVLREDPADMATWRAFWYVLRIRTVILMIVASGLGYFFFAGVRAFALLFVTYHYGISRNTASGLIVLIGIGILAGLTVGARAPDWLLNRGHANGRVWVAAFSLLTASVVLAPGLATTSPALATPLLAAGAGLLAAANPPLDAARLDIVPPGLWGRSEAIRTFVRTTGEFAAPLLFGVVAAQVFGGQGQAAGLQKAFLLALVPLFVAGGISLLALRTYPRDVATALASARAGRQDSRDR